MPQYQRHVFICVNQRPPDSPRGCCAAKGGAEVRAAFKQGLKARRVNHVVRANAAGCLDACASGVTVVIYPEGIWYAGVSVADVEEIIEQHILGGEVVRRLLPATGPVPRGGLPPLKSSGSPGEGS